MTLSPRPPSSPQAGSRWGFAFQRPRIVRLVNCRGCGHKLRFGASRCGQCWQRAPMCNQGRVYLGLAAALLAAGLWVVLAFARA